MPSDGTIRCQSCCICNGFILGGGTPLSVLGEATGADGKVIIDDYAHHPDELRQSILSVKALYPERPLTVAFQPHLYSRTRDFAREFGEALSLADDVILVDIYPAREEPIPGVTSAIIFDHIDGPSKTMVSKSRLPEAVASSGFSVLPYCRGRRHHRLHPQNCKAIYQR